MPPEHFRVPACMYSEAIAENANARSPDDVNCWVRPYRLRRPRRQDSCRCAAGRDGHLPRRSTGRTVEWRLPLLGPREFLAKGKKAPSTKERTPRRVDAVDMPAAAVRAALVQDGRTAGEIATAGRARTISPCRRPMGVREARTATGPRIHRL